MMYPNALEAGISAYDYWEMTYGEIINTIKSYNTRKKTEMQWNASVNYKLADLIGISVSRLLDDNVEFPKIESAFPGLFEDIVEQKPKQQDWKVMKDRMESYADGWNNRKK